MDQMRLEQGLSGAYLGLILGAGRMAAGISVVASLEPKGSKYPMFTDSLVPKTIEGMVFGSRVLKYWVLGPSGRYWAPLQKTAAIYPCSGLYFQ